MELAALDVARGLVFCQESVRIPNLSHMRSTFMKRTPSYSVVSLVVVLSLLGFSVAVHAQQEVCTGPSSGRDVFSVGEVRTSILPQETFQELNGAEWALMDGRPLMVRTALSPYLSEEGRHGLKIPDARGRFLRMANNGACADLRNNEEAYNKCLAGHDPDGDRLSGAYQADIFGAHDHGRHSHAYHDEYYPTQGRRGQHSDRTMEAGYQNRSRHQTSEDGVPHSGGNETRPRNIAVNFYIKICNCRTDICK